MTLNDITVSWVDDDSYALWSLVEPLEESGAKVQTYQSYADVVEKISDVLMSDLILLDIILPPGKAKASEELGIQYQYWGSKLLYRLRREFNYQKPIIAFSIVGGAVISEEEMVSLNVMQLNKYCDPEQLKEIVVTALNIPPGS